MSRPFLAPEVLQISSMDCGVAALTCMLAGFGIDANYEKLREACQTQVDGTSIDALEDLCRDLGLAASQHVVPHDLVDETMNNRMPLIALTEPSPGRLHFVTVWRRVGSLIQSMDPRGGRVWTNQTIFEASLFRHSQRLSLDDWKQWFAASSLREALEKSAAKLLTSELVGSTCKPVLDGGAPDQVAALDASLRLIRQTVHISGAKSRQWCDALFGNAFRAALSSQTEGVPSRFWAIHSDDEEVQVDGAVLLAVESSETTVATEPIHTIAGPGRLDLGARVRTSLFKSVMQTLGPHASSFVPWVVLGASALAIASALELLVYRVALDIPRLVTTPESRIGASTALVGLLLILAGLEIAVTHGGNRLGRLLELKLRMKTLWSIPRVEDEFIKSRPTSDLAYRAHALSLAGRLVPSFVDVGGAIGDLTVTLAGMAFLDPGYAVIAMIGSVLFVGAWYAARNRLQEVDTRLQVHASRLLSILLDALRGIRPVRLHGYQDAFRDDQKRELVSWKNSAYAQVDVTSRLESQYIFLNVLVVGTIFALFVRHHYGDARAFVVLAFWSFRIPTIIRRLVLFAHRYPLERNALDRLLEVTRQVVDEQDSREVPNINPGGVAIRMTDVSVILGGHSVLQNVNLEIPSGQHVAVVGASGSGKSTLISMLLGLHQPSQGQLSIDGKPLDTESRQALRAATMWIDPGIQLWNKSLGSNLDYACRGYGRRPTLEVLEKSDLLGMLATVPRGLDAPLGAEGAFVSGGEGQRIRVGRALFRAGTRLALLDEPFRGLDRSTRRHILEQVRLSALRSTMLFVSHDVSQALSFERVIVIDGGKVVEDGSPQELATQNSLFARLLDAEKEMLTSAWSGRRWRRIRVGNGRVHEENNGA